MVRFQWYADDGSVGQVLPGNFTQDASAHVSRATAEIKIPGQRATVEAHFALPKEFLKETEPIGIALSIGDRAPMWINKFLSELETALAKQGHITIRYPVKSDEHRKQSEIQKTIGACLASPYVQFVKKWVLVGVGSTSNVINSISQFFEGVLTAMIFAASSLTLKYVSDPDHAFKTSEKLDEIPMLLLHPSVAEACSKEVLLDRLRRSSTNGIKYMTIPDVDQNFRTTKGKNAAHLVSSFIVSAILEFLNILKSDRLENCLMPSLEQQLEATASVSETPVQTSERTDSVEKTT